MEKVNIKDLIFSIENSSFQKVLKYLVENAKKRDKKTFVITVNPEILMLAINNSDYLNVLKSANLALPDGVGIILAGIVFGHPFKERVTGVDLMERLCEEVSKQPITVGFLGGKQNVAERTAERLVKKYPGLRVAFATEEWPKSRSSFSVSRPVSESSNVKRKTIRASKPLDLADKQMSADILFVAFGPPKQEKWISENLPNLDVRVAIGVGGAFDFISGKVRRAPKWVRNLGLEWLFRLIIQPWRAKRQTALVKFIFLVLKEKFSI